MLATLSIKFIFNNRYRFPGWYCVTSIFHVQTLFINSTFVGPKISSWIWFLFSSSNIFSVYLFSTTNKHNNRCSFFNNYHVTVYTYPLRNHWQLSLLPITVLIPYKFQYNFQLRTCINRTVIDTQTHTVILETKLDQIEHTNNLSVFGSQQRAL